MQEGYNLKEASTTEKKTGIYIMRKQRIILKPYADESEYRG